MTNQAAFTLAKVVGSELRKASTNAMLEETEAAFAYCDEVHFRGQRVADAFEALGLLSTFNAGCAAGDLKARMEEDDL